MHFRCGRSNRQHRCPCRRSVRYVKATCVAVLCGALALLAFHQIIFGCLFLAAFFYSVFSAARSSRIYKQNREKASTEGSERDK